jgi:hypothetical protein
MNGRNCVCHSCGRRVEFDSKDVPCEVLRGWLIVSHLKGVEEVDHISFCSPSCLKRWADDQTPPVPDVFIRSLEEEDI